MGSPARHPAPPYSADDNIEAILDRDPRTAEVLLRFGLRCQDCVVAASESLVEGCRPLGVDVQQVLTALNALNAER